MITLEDQAAIVAGAARCNVAVTDRWERVRDIAAEICGPASEGEVAARAAGTKEGAIDGNHSAAVG